MSFNQDQVLDADEALRIIDMLAGESGTDYHMMIDNKGKKIVGESQRVFGDVMEMMDIGGYYYNAKVTAAPGSTKGVVKVSPLIVVRDADAATASIAGLLNNQDQDLVVNILVFKASGDGSNDLQPFFQIELRGARVAFHAVITGGVPKRPCEIIAFQQREAEIRSAPQLNTGLRGAVRTARLVNSVA